MGAAKAYIHIGNINADDISEWISDPTLILKLNISCLDFSDRICYTWERTAGFCAVLRLIHYR